MKIGLVGQSYRERSLPFDAQRTINMYPVADPQGKQVSALYGTPGLTTFGVAGAGAVRGVFAAANGRAFVVSGAGLYEVVSAGTTTLLGTLDSASGIVLLDENGLQLGICDGTKLYILTYATNVFAAVTDIDLPSPVGTLTFIDGYFVVSITGTGKFYISALYNGLSWSALDFATAESSPDVLVRVINAVGQLWLFGDKTTEIWSNTGDSAFPFQRISGAKMEQGCAAPFTVLSLDNSVFWVGADERGTGIVFRAQGFTPSRVSTHAIEEILQRAGTSNLSAYSYQADGHVFYVITGGSLETTLVYDLSTQLWHERAFLNSAGNLEPHLASCLMFVFGYHLVGDRRNGNIYKLSQDVYSDNGDEILRERTYTHLADEDKRIRYNRLQVDFETGVGLQSGQGSDPLVTLYFSNDGAKTWSSGYTQSIGRAGDYRKQVVFRRLGYTEQRTFRIRITDPVKIAIIGSYLS